MTTVQGLAESGRGITVIEMLIVLALVGVLAAVAVPNLTHLFRGGDEEAFVSDRRALQSAVDRYREANRDLLPIQAEAEDSVTQMAEDLPKCPDDLTPRLPKSDRCAIGLAVLVSGGFLPRPEAVRSASQDNGAGGTGSYTYVLLSTGRVEGFLSSAGTRGFAKGRYP